MADKNKSGTPEVTFVMDGKVIGIGETVEATVNHDEVAKSKFFTQGEATFSISNVKSNIKQMSPRLRMMFKVIRRNGKVYF